VNGNEQNVDAIANYEIHAFYTVPEQFTARNTNVVIN
jgi:hypothetical protein